MAQAYTLWIVVGSLAVVSHGCATPSGGTRPDDMNAAAHRAQAAKHRREGAKQARGFDPSVQATRVTGGGPVAAREILDWPDQTYNPTAFYLQRAEEHAAHAQQHAAAATALERFEAKSCHGFSKETRVACPLVRNVVRAEDIPGGARLHMRAGLPPKAVLAHARCHYAFGRKMGHEGMSHCPLYLKGLELRLSDNGQALEITSKVVGAARRIRLRAKKHLAADSTQSGE